MLSSDIYNNYLSLAERAELILQSFNESTYTSVNRFYGLELRSIHKNIRFLYKKLISMLSNKAVWNNFSQPCNMYGYRATVSNDISLSAEFEFLLANRDEFIRQLDCIINTTAFEIDLKFLDICVEKLEKLYNRLENKNYAEIARPDTYSLAS